MPVSSWSTTASNNATSDSASGINWAEGMSPAQVNDSARAMMAETKAWYNDVPRLSASNTFTQANVVNGASASLMVSQSALLSGGASGTALFQTTGATGVRPAAMFITDGASAGYVAFYRSGIGVVGSVAGNGGTGVVYNTSSDYRLKAVDPAKPVDALGRIEQLHVYRGYWKGDATRTERSLMLAHEIQQAIPYVVTGEKDAVWHGQDAEGNPITEPVYQQVDYMGMIPDLIAALQEANNKIKAVESRVSALEAKN